jgi:hypothetical protein
MKRCRRCNCSSLNIIRETTTRRARHEYTLYWYSCPECQEVSFSYRILQALPLISADASRERPELGTSMPEPVRS